jgi:hypothetical protein
VTDVLRVAVIGDSTAFTDDTGPQLPDHPALWPNVMARQLEQELGRAVQVTVWARPGNDVLEAWRAVTKDRLVMFDVVGPADVAIVAVGSLDHAPAGLPPMLDAVLPHLRPDGVRRRARRVVRALHPRVVALRRARGLRTPAHEFARRYGQLLEQVHGLTLGRALLIALGPTSHRAPHHGGVHPRREESEARHLALATRHGATVVPVWEHVTPHVAALNPDGIHWPPVVHAAVGRAVATEVSTALSRRR